MNLRRFSAAIRASRLAAEQELPALERAYLRLLGQVGRDAATALIASTERGALVAATAETPDWQPPPEGELLEPAALADLAADRLRKAHARIVKQVAGGPLARMGIAWDITHPVTQAMLDAAGQRTGQRLAQGAGDVVRQTVAEAYAAGLPVRDTAALIRAKLGEAAPGQAQMLARTDLNSLANGGSVMAAQLVGVETKSWLTSQDELVRETHAEADGQTVPIDQPFDVGGEQLDYPGDPGGSDAEVCNCFPGETLVAGTITSAMRSPYFGELIRVTTHGGRILSGTPNHPVLTLDGWVALKSVNEGDQLICASLDQWAMPGAADIDEMPSSIEQIWDALSLERASKRIARANVDFHGDSPNGDIHVVGADGLLELPHTPSFLKPPQQFAFPVPDSASGSLPGNSFSDQFSRPGGATSTGGLSSERQGGSLVGTHASHADQRGLGATATLDAALSQAALDDRATSSEFASDLLLREFVFDVEAHDGVNVNLGSIASHGDVAISQVIPSSLTGDSVLPSDLSLGHSSEVVRDEVASVEALLGFHGDVFTLDTLQGYYIANGVIVQNCRCTVIYGEVIKGEAASAAPRERVPSRGFMGLGKAIAHASTNFKAGRMPAKGFAAATTIVVDAPPATPAAWVSDLAFEGMATEDGRYILPGALGWRDLPLSLGAMFDTPHADMVMAAPVCGRIDQMTFEDTNMDGEPLAAGVRAVRGYGEFDTAGEDGAEVARMVGDETMRGVSIDLAVDDWCYRDPATGELIEPDDASDAEMERAFFGELQYAVRAGTIMAATVCPTPAFADARIALVADGRRVLRLWAPLRLADGPLTASAAGLAPTKPPAAWFALPEAAEPTPLTVTQEGQVYGHMALYDSCHLGFPGQCVPPPRSPSGYAYFNLGEVECADGSRVACGALTLEALHADVDGRSYSPDPVRSYYENTAVVAAHVRASDGRHGIWVAGALRPGLSERHARDLMGAKPSGDWQPVRPGGQLEMLGVHAVNRPGYPVPRLAASALLPSGACAELEFEDPEPPARIPAHGFATA